MDLRPPSSTFLTGLAGLVVGVGIALATSAMASAGPVGDGWSFRGNGALVVPLGFGAAALAGGWVALCLYGRAIRGWAVVGAVVGAVSSIPALLSIVVLVIFGSGAQLLSDLLTIPAFALPLLSAGLACAIHLRPTGPRRLPTAETLVAGGTYALGLGAGLIGSETLVSIAGAVA